ncbi:MAG TPA: phosphate acyltransferase [Candidatus Cloacimonadota bacterium]|nr:phosphate acyltransferase [Candidatus Cloacimonadota bacterium]HPT71400.1 phosphate acyltransferase [Candidatus Cloacimonadota bacterium]
MPITKLDQLIDACKAKPRRKLVAAYANDSHTICAVSNAVDMGVIDGILIGDESMIKRVCEEEKVDYRKFQIIHETVDTACAAKAVKMINDKGADLLMKGLLSTEKYMKAILNKECGLMNPGAVLSHIAVIEVPTYHKLLIISDVAVLPAPEFSQKVAQINYLIAAANALGIDNPKIGLLSASESVSTKIMSSYEAAVLSKMSDRGQFKKAIIEGPVSFDIMVDKESAKIKGFDSPIAGDVDCILFPNIESGQVFYKGMTKLCNAELAAYVAGARVPAVLSSRGDSTKTKLYSIALASLVCK